MSDDIFADWTIDNWGCIGDGNVDEGVRKFFEGKGEEGDKMFRVAILEYAI